MIGTSRFAVVYLILSVTWAFLHFHTEAPVPIATPLTSFPTRCSDWRMINEYRFSEDILKVLRPTDYLCRIYEKADGKSVNLYIGYHDGSKQSGEIHSPKHCLPGSGWHVVSSDPMKLATDDGEVNLTRAVYQKGDSRELFLYWFQVQKNTLANEYSLKIAELTNSLLHQRRDAAFIRISMPLEGEEGTALASGEAFIRNVYPHIRKHIPL